MPQSILLYNSLLDVTDNNIVHINDDLLTVGNVHTTYIRCGSISIGDLTPSVTHIITYSLSLFSTVTPAAGYLIAGPFDLDFFYWYQFF